MESKIIYSQDSVITDTDQPVIEKKRNHWVGIDIDKSRTD